MYKKALRRNIPIFTLLGVTLALTIGLFLSLSCYIIYTDFFKSGSSDAELSSESYVILNKKVSLINMFGAKEPVFSKDEIKNLEDQSFIEEVAVFEAAKFRIKAYAPMHEDRSFYTDLFLEAVPSKFLDVGSDFTWKKGRPQLPIIVPRSYLNLYNFGFAPSQNLPQINESTVATLTIKMEMEGPGGKHTFWGRINAFTDRVNSILVPEEFISWANENIGNVDSSEPSRVIIKSNNTADPALTKFIDQNNYSTNKELLQASKAASVFKMIISFEFFQGVLILLLSLGLILLSTLLLVERNKTLIFKLRLMSISSSNITRFYSNYFIVCAGLALFIAFILIAVFRSYYISLISEFGFPISHSRLGIIGAGIVLGLISAGLAYLRIKSRVRDIL